jgi:pimeloyl-ACP methyl ester carboxylesterase
MLLLLGTKLHVVVLGSGPQAVLFLHGFPDSSALWQQQVAPLAWGYSQAISTPQHSATDLC